MQPESTLLKKEGSSGARYEGNGILFSAIHCSPISIPNEVPFNLGD